MAFNPIAVLDQVTDEYRDYIQTEFRARDASLRQRLLDALDRQNFLAREPFFQAHRPFRIGKKWADLPLDEKFARVMEERAKGHGSPTAEYAYTHQSGAIDELLSPTARPVVVTTGTGSGKTEAFLLPVLQNALLDARAFNRPGLTSILIYPMNALANDQRERITGYLKSSGLDSAISVAQYDRSTSQTDRERLRNRPPHILLTNYMMLEYLLVRPADRDGIFANHRCRFLVLDEVHTYRGTLGANIALLVRRLRAHLESARQDWQNQPTEELRPRRFPKLIPIGTSATIKSTREGATEAEAKAERTAAVQEFFGRLAGVNPITDIQVFGEELQPQAIPSQAAYASSPVTGLNVNPADPESVRTTLCKLAGVAENASAADAATHCRLLWDLNRWLIRSPLSLDQLVEKVRAEVAQRKDADPAQVKEEVHAALIAGTALPDDAPCVLRMRAHRFFRGGWRFHRCLDPNCGHLMPMGEEQCAHCGGKTAPLLLCRACGADYIALEGEIEKPLQPARISQKVDQSGWMVYEVDRFEGQVQADDDDADDDSTDPQPQPASKKKSATTASAPPRPQPRGAVEGKLNYGTLEFSPRLDAEGTHVFLYPGTKKCLCCGGTAGSHPVVTRVEMGTSAAVKVLAEGTVESLHEANQGRADYDGKDRLLIFADSRQDAAHQARFIQFTGRYDRMRTRVYSLLKKGPLKFQKLVELLGEEGVKHRDNPECPSDPNIIPRGEMRDRIRIWEEAPLNDQLAANANYRGTLVNLGLLQVDYPDLLDIIQTAGGALLGKMGITAPQMAHVCRCILDEMRTHSAFSRDMLRYHPAYISFPEKLRSAQWERSISSPAGYACDAKEKATNELDPHAIPYGIRLRTIVRGKSGKGRAPGIQRIVEGLVSRFGGHIDDTKDILDLVDFLREHQFIVAAQLFGLRQDQTLLQVNAEEVQLTLTDDSTRMRCNVCLRACAGAIAEAPCPHCRGAIQPWPKAEFETSRAVRRVQEGMLVPLFAGEHTAQVPAEARNELEQEFKAPAAESSRNVLACSPTLEMGIDVGGLEAVAMRNIPPRPDNYAQRGGRAGRRARVGLVVGYASRKPHDQYFYEHPEEMIAGEVPTPTFSLSNRDVVLRHAAAIVFGAADPGLAGQMSTYVSKEGKVEQAAVDALKNAVLAKVDHAAKLAQSAFGTQLASAGIDDAALRSHLASLTDRIQDVMDRTAKQVQELRQSVMRFAQELDQQKQAMRASDLIKRLLGIRDQSQAGQKDADDRSAGYPLRRFAEFGILPGYEFPTEPASLRLLSDLYEDDPITTDRRFGIGQFQPEAPVFARTRRWRVSGIDTSSPWNPQSEGPSWQYRVCRGCGLRHRVSQPRCPRCNDDQHSPDLPAFEYGGFVATKNEAPVLQEEDRFAARDLVRLYPQWDGDLVACWSVADAWSLQLRQRETVDWVNEGPAPTQDELARGAVLHNDAVGYSPCGVCGRMLEASQQPARRGSNADPFGHAASCPNRNRPPVQGAIATTRSIETLRLIIPIPRPTAGDDGAKESIQAWGRSLGESLLAGISHLYMIEDDEVGFELEGPWEHTDGGITTHLISLTFTDPTVGGSGYLQKIAGELNLAAEHALNHLEHPDCQTSCYRCLKAYNNQRYHQLLQWPLAVPALEAIKAAAPAAVACPVGSVQDPKPWLEAYAAGVGSPLELKFWRLFEQHGFTPEKQVPIHLSGGGTAFSIADFAVPSSQLAIYVDGASVHVGNRLRRDRFIRQRMREATPAWKVVELRAQDLGKGEALVNQLKAMI